MSDNVRFVQDLYAAFGRGDVAAVLAGCAEGVEWASNADPSYAPWGGRRVGHEGATAFLVALGDNLDIEIFEPQNFYDAGSAVIVTGRTIARARRSGRPLASDWAHVFDLDGGKVTRFREFYDTQGIAAAMAMPEGPFDPSSRGA